MVPGAGKGWGVITAPVLLEHPLLRDVLAGRWICLSQGWMCRNGSATPQQSSLHNIQEELFHGKGIGAALGRGGVAIPGDVQGTTGRGTQCSVRIGHNLDFVIFSNLWDLRDEVYGENKWP